jgi:hypothetical protein
MYNFVFMETMQHQLITQEEISSYDIQVQTFILLTSTDFAYNPLETYTLLNGAMWLMCNTISYQ